MDRIDIPVTAVSTEEKDLPLNERVRRPQPSCIGSAALGVAFYYLTSLIVVIGVLLGMHLLKQCTVHPDSTAMNGSDFFERLGPWDGVWFRRIATEGYSYDPRQMSSVAFYPLYPLFGRLVVGLTGWRVEVALAVVSHLALMGFFALFAVYMAAKSRSEDGRLEYTLLALGLFPTSFYLRMSYTESLFLFCCMLVFLGLQRNWPLIVVALLIGAATAARPVGIALIPPFLWHLKSLDKRLGPLALRSIALIPFCVWGIAAYMLYQHLVFGDALAFAKTQIHWYERTPPAGIKNALALLSLEPLRAVYDSTSRCYWAHVPPYNLPIFNMFFMNPIFVLFTWGCIAIGARKRWINTYEVLFSLGVLAIPYLTHAYRGCMCSNARYALMAFPLFIILGRVLSNLPPTIAHIVFSLSSVFLMSYTALFVSWYWFY